MSKALCIGHASYDVTVHVDGYPTENKKYHVSELMECSGGQAAIAATLLAMWGIDTSFAGVVGSDNYGNTIEREFKEAGVKLNYFEKKKGKKTSYSFIMVNETNASRTIINNTEKDIKLEDMKIKIKPGLIHLDSYEIDFAKKAIESNKDAIKVIDAGGYKPEAVELAHMVDYLVCSKDFAEGFAGCEIDELNLNGIFERIEKEFGNTVVITLGEMGSIYRYNGEIKRLGIYKTEAKDTTGAGDIFHGAFCYSLLMGYDLEKTIKISSLTSALSVEKYGARNSIPKLNSVMELYNNNVL